MSDAKAVFLSYASNDALAAQRIADALRESGITVWFDKDALRGGDAWDASIRRQIKECLLFVPIISAHTEARVEGYFRREWNLAADRMLDMGRGRTFIVPVSIDGVSQERADVPDRFLEVQWTQLPEGNTTPAFLADIRRLVGIDTQAQAGNKSTTHSSTTNATRHKPVAAYAVIAILAFAIAGGAWRFSQERQAGSANQPAIMDMSIAVLPFTDMSEKHDQEYFSDGISEELIDALAKISTLHVTARTSSFHFKGRSDDIVEIARKLRVANVLEGSVRKSGNTIRVTAQLIRADQGFHVWSETYERSFSDVFKVQDDIVRSVVGALKVSMLAEQAIAERAPANLEAYNLYLRARYAYERASISNVSSAVALAQRATAIDSNYAPAWALMSKAYAWQIGFGGVKNIDQIAIEARNAAQRALALDANSTAAHIALSDVAIDHDYDAVAAEREIAAAERIAPNDPETLAARGSLAVRRGSISVGIEKFRLALDKDPYQIAIWRRLGVTYWCAGRFEESKRVFHRALEENPDATAVHYAITRVLLQEGDIKNAILEAEQAPDDWSGRTARALAYDRAGRRAEADVQLKKLIEFDVHDASLQIAEVYMFRGDTASALNWLERAYQERDGGFWNLMLAPTWNPLHGDRRFEALLRKTGAKD